MKEKLGGGEEEKKEEEAKKHEHEHEHEAVPIPVEKVEEAAHPEEKKGFLDKIKEKLPGHSKKPEEAPEAPAPCATEAAAPPHHHEEDQGKEKKGFLEKIKEKLPGYHAKEDQEKHKEEAASH